MANLSAIGPDLDDSHYTRAEEVQSKKKERRTNGKSWNKSGYNSGNSSKSTKSSRSSSSGTASMALTDRSESEDEAPPWRRHGQRASDVKADEDYADDSSEEE